MRIEPGDLDQEIRFLTFARVDDGKGGTTKAWRYISHDPNDWAKVVPRSAGETLRDGRTTATGIYMFTIHQRDDLSETMAIEWCERRYNIRSLGHRGPRDMYQTIEAEFGI